MTSRWVARWLTMVMLSLLPQAADAHTMNAAFLGLQETNEGQVQLRLKIPTVDGRTAPVRPILPKTCSPIGPVARHQVRGGVVDRWAMNCEGTLAGQLLRFTGLDAMVGEVLLLYEREDAAPWRALIRRQAPETLLGGEATADTPAVAGYLALGFSHILEGPDHLLFVLALLLIIGRTRRGRDAMLALLGTITAFTLAHSLTLALATLGAVRLPSRPTEVVIALSVLLLAYELATSSGPKTLTLRRPWLVAFGFGLLHGFGFAGALMEIGLPEDQIALPLLLFNVGVEAGQLAFVAVAGLIGGALVAASGRFGGRWVHTPRWVETATIYLIGTTAAYWCIDRIAGMG
jgi:hydrogenase/urease accessory protein HupE